MIQKPNEKDVSVKIVRNLHGDNLDVVTVAVNMMIAEVKLVAFVAGCFLFTRTSGLIGEYK